jgi:hypothetical protein
MGALIVIAIVVVIFLATSGGRWRTNLAMKRARNATHGRNGYCKDCRHIARNTSLRHVRSDYFCSIRITPEGVRPNDINHCCEPPD